MAERVADAAPRMISMTPCRTSQAMLGTVGDDDATRISSPETLQLRTCSTRSVGSSSRSSERGPVVIAIEDLHWADASTLHALRLLLPESRDDLAPVRTDDRGATARQPTP